MLFRSVLGAAVAAPFVASIPAAAAQAWRGSTAAAPGSGELVTNRAYTTDWSSSQDVSFPSRWRVPLGLRSGGTVLLKYDSRLFVVSPVVMAERAGALMHRELSWSEPGTCRVSVPPNIEWLHFGVQALELYPHENLGTVIATSLTARGKDHASVPTPYPITIAPAAPWGIELRADWASADGYSVPQVIQLLSVGPNAVPAGVKVDVLASAQAPTMRGASSWKHARANGSTRRNTQQGVSFDVLSAVPGGQSVTFTLATPSARGGKRFTLNSVALVSADVPAHLRSNARATGRESIAPVTRSGTELTDFSIAATA